MKKMLLSAIIHIALVLGVLAEDLPLRIRLGEALDGYQVVLAKESASATEPKALCDYYEVCQDAFAALREFQKDPIQPFSLPDNALQKRKVALVSLIVSNGLVDKVRAEDAAFGAVAVELLPQWNQQLQRERILFERKYFEDDDKKASWVGEQWLNGHASFTKYDSSSEASGRTFGVSPWELTLRAEPVVMLDSANSTAGLLSLGIVRNLFPAFELNKAGDQVKAIDDFWSGKIKRLGLRLGAGSDIGEGDLRFVGGAGVQVASFTLWGLYRDAESEFVLAVGLSDLDWLKKVLPFFQ